MSKVKFRDVSRFLSERVGINVQNDPYQSLYLQRLIESPAHMNGVFVDAVAGTGKTSIAVSVGYYLLNMGFVDQIIYIRTPVTIRELGFLPGDLAEKEAPYMTPGLEALSKLEPNNPKLIETLISNNQLEVKTTAFLRGLDWSGNKFIIVDEAQNISLNELQTIFTRLHDSSKIVVIGSSIQCDEINPVEGTHLLPFQIYAKHFKENGVAIAEIMLKNNYRGRFSAIADEINNTINQLKNNKFICNNEKELDENQLWIELHELLSTNIRNYGKTEVHKR